MSALLSELMECPDAETLADLVMTPGNLERRAAIADHAGQCEGCHAALLAVLGPPNDRERIGRYIVEKRIGAGGMGVVYKARDPELQRDVAIKMLYRGAPAERLRREAQALARLAHPNVVAVHDVGEHEGQTFIAMALVDGATLRRWLAIQRTGPEIVRVLCEAARGIAAAHAARLVHRDLKPDNVFVSRANEVLVGDFGLAREGGEVEPGEARVAIAGDLTQTGTILGTPAYMAPEQAAGAATELSDQFSFCVMAYEALYGTRPFAGSNLDELVDAIERGDMAAPMRDPGVGPGVESALRRGLAANPTDRFPTMTALRVAIEPRPRRWPLAAGGIAAVAAASMITWTAMRSSEVPDPAIACEPTRRAFAETWNGPRRVSWIVALRGAGKREDAAIELAVRLDRFADDWATTRYDTCVGAATGLLDGDKAAQRVACLDTRRAEFEATFGSATTTGEDVLLLWRRVSAMASPASCRDAAHAFGVGHQALMLAAAKARTYDELAGVAARADRERDEHAQLVLALRLAARALTDNHLADADARARRAVTLAESLAAPLERVRALALSSRALCMSGKDDEADRFLEMADAASRRVSDAAALDDVRDARATCLARRRRFPEALPLLVDALERAHRRYGPDSFEAYELHERLMMAYDELGKTADSAREAAEFNRLFLKLVGGSDAELETQVISALQRRDIDASIEYQRRIVASRTAARAPGLADAHIDLAMLLEATGAWGAVIANYDEALKLIPANPDEEHAKLRAEALVSRGESQLRLGKYALAAPDFTRGVAEGEQQKRADLVARSQLGLGRVAVEQGEHARAIRLFRDALPVLIKTDTVAKFLIGENQFAFARAMWEVGERAAARAMARQAEDTVAISIDEAKKHPATQKLVPFRQARLSMIERWRSTHP